MYPDTISDILERAVNRGLEESEYDYRWDQERIDSHVNNMTNLELVKAISYAVAEAINDLHIS